ncbi:hypothetical protein [Clavibacter tessellarius]|uniref:hypothetical protein n=1 Tax=Clavibacter tessellarius TaxID=31965 RepID=UPI00324E50D1
MPVGRIRATARAARSTDLRSMKLATRAGLGICQGRVCGRTVEELLAGRRRLRDPRLLDARLPDPRPPAPAPTAARSPRPCASARLAAAYDLRDAGPPSLAAAAPGVDDDRAIRAPDHPAPARTTDRKDLP